MCKIFFERILLSLLPKFRIQVEKKVYATVTTDNKDLSWVIFQIFFMKTKWIKKWNFYVDVGPILIQQC